MVGLRVPNWSDTWLIMSSNASHSCSMQQLGTIPGRIRKPDFRHGVLRGQSRWGSGTFTPAQTVVFISEVTP